VVPDIAGIHHISVTVTDIERSVPWYSEVLGLTKLMDEAHPDGSGYAIILGKPDFSMCVGLHTHQANEREQFSETRTGLDHLSFMVADRAELDAWEERLTELGVAHSPVNDQGAYAVLVFRDPDNIQLEFISMG
jgi:glyoxylase I family protein